MSKASANASSILTSAVDEKISHVDLVGGSYMFFSLILVFIGMVVSAEALVSPALTMAFIPAVTILPKLSYSPPTHILHVDVIYLENDIDSTKISSSVIR